MTIPQHIAQGIIISFSIWDNIYFVITASILSAIPDIGRLFQRDVSDWNKFYWWAHNTRYLYLIPFWNIHIIQDYFIHEKKGGWKWWGKYVEVFLWLIEIPIFLILFCLNKN